MSIPAQVVQLSAFELDNATARVRQRTLDKNGGVPSARFLDHEWARLSYANRRVLKGGKNYLEIGPGGGWFAKIVNSRKIFERMVAVDIVERRALPSAVEFVQQSIEKLDYPDKSFDTVVCMEVLEHLDDATLASGLANLRRMCARQLLITLPFCEPLPLPEYHHQRFSESRVRELFPNGKYSILLKEPVTRVPWIFIEERLD